MNPTFRQRAALQFRPGRTITSTIVWSTVAVFLAQLIGVKWFNSIWLDETFALSHQGLAAHDYWQLLTYAWLHSETLYIHILFNMTMVYFLGRQLEGPLGSTRFLILYLGSVLAAAGVWLFLSPHSDATIEGASGAAFGLLAAYATYDPKSRLRAWILFVIPINTTARNLALFLIGFEVICYFTGFLNFIAHEAHIGGALFGFLIMKIWNVRRPEPVTVFSNYNATPDPL